MLYYLILLASAVVGALALVVVGTIMEASDK